MQYSSESSLGLRGNAIISELSDTFYSSVSDNQKNCCHCGGGFVVAETACLPLTISTCFLSPFWCILTQTVLHGAGGCCAFATTILWDGKKLKDYNVLRKKVLLDCEEYKDVIVPDYIIKKIAKFPLHRYETLLPKMNVTQILCCKDAGVNMNKKCLTDRQRSLVRSIEKIQKFDLEILLASLENHHCPLAKMLKSQPGSYRYLKNYIPKGFQKNERVIEAVKKLYNIAYNPLQEDLLITIKVNNDNKSDELALDKATIELLKDNSSFFESFFENSSGEMTLFDDPSLIKRFIHFCHTEEWNYQSLEDMSFAINYESEVLVKKIETVLSLRVKNNFFNLEELFELLTSKEINNYSKIESVCNDKIIEFIYQNSCQEYDFYHFLVKNELEPIKIAYLERLAVCINLSNEAIKVLKLFITFPNFKEENALLEPYYLQFLKNTSEGKYSSHYRGMVQLAIEHNRKGVLSACCEYGKKNNDILWEKWSELDEMPEVIQACIN